MCAFSVTITLFSKPHTETQIQKEFQRRRRNIVCLFVFYFFSLEFFVSNYREKCATESNIKLCKNFFCHFFFRLWFNFCFCEIQKIKLLNLERETESQLTVIQNKFRITNRALSILIRLFHIHTHSALTQSQTIFSHKFPQNIII